MKKYAFKIGLIALMLFIFAGCNDKNIDSKTNENMNEYKGTQLKYYIDNNGSVYETYYNSLDDFYTCAYIKKDVVLKCKEYASKAPSSEFSNDYNVIDAKILYYTNYLKSDITGNYELKEDDILYKKFDNLEDIYINDDSYELGAILRSCNKDILRKIDGSIINKEITYFKPQIAEIEDSKIVLKEFVNDKLNKKYLEKINDVNILNEYSLTDDIWYGGIKSFGEIKDNYLIAKSKSYFEGLDYEIKGGLIYFNLDFMLN